MGLISLVFCAFGKGVRGELAVESFVYCLYWTRIFLSVILEHKDALFDEFYSHSESKFLFSIAFSLVNIQTG